MSRCNPYQMICRPFPWYASTKFCFVCVGTVENRAFQGTSLSTAAPSRLGCARLLTASLARFFSTHWAPFSVSSPSRTLGLPGWAASLCPHSPAPHTTCAQALFPATATEQKSFRAASSAGTERTNRPKRTREAPNMAPTVPTERGESAAIERATQGGHQSEGGARAPGAGAWRGVGAAERR